MATVKVRHQLNSSYIRDTIGRSQRLRNYLEIRGLAVRSASQQRLRQPPQRIDTGNLINSIQMRTFTRRGFPVVRIGTSVEYSLFVHNGTAPHVIRPRNARALAFPGRDGRTVFAMRVNHPGMQANPFLVDGLARGMAMFR